MYMMANYIMISVTKMIGMKKLLIKKNFYHYNNDILIV